MSELPSVSSPEMAQMLALEARLARRRRLVRWGAAAAALVVAVITAALLWPQSGSQVRYVSAKVERGALTVVVTATGTLQPTNQVDVGSELSGIVRTVEVDFNDRVRVGQPLARLDTAKLEGQVLQSQAQLKAAEAKLREAQANEDETRRRLARAQDLFGRQFVSEEALVTAQAAHQRAAAALESVRSQVDQAAAVLAIDRTNLAKAVIRSPIDGTVLARKVEPGQTVAATLQAPVLFTLAQDLARMELRVDVDEADIGRIEPGQRASFTVDAYPGREFPSTVAQTRYAAKTVSGVVTYETVLAVDNAELLLRPGMTATASVTVAELADALLVPNAALRFTPTAPAARDQRSLVSRLLPRPPRAPSAIGPASGRRQQQVWSLREGTPVAIPVKVGATDGRMTEVLGGELTPGLEVLIDAQTLK
jgi:HlyD family secretion protein